MIDSSLQHALRERTKGFARDVIGLLTERPNSQALRIVGNQLLRAATSVAANYRATGRARSRRDFVSKIGMVLEEADETLFWLELLSDAKLFDAARLQPLLREANELVRIFSASQATATRRRRIAPSDGPPDRQITR